MASRADSPGSALRRTALAAALAVAGWSGAAGAAGNDNAALLAEIRKLAERVERIEQRNRDLEQKLVASKDAEQRLKALEESRAQTEKALATERLSEKEPELATRLKAVEFQTLSMQKQARQIEALEGITVGASLTGVAHKANGRGTASAERESRANYRGDVSVTLPGGDMGNAEGKIFAHFRFGQGNGVGLRPTYTSTPNTTAFQTNAGADDSFTILAQAWYQLKIPLPVDGFKPHSREHLHLTFGKIDPFVFFDQNAAADDESTRFLSNAFVHNPLLDSGGDVGADAYGFSPGAIVQYMNEHGKPDSWGVSLGLFGSGAGANFSGSLSEPFVIAQLETSRKFFRGLTGNYRAYLWRNGRAAGFNGVAEQHAGWGVSADQRVGDAITLFGRLGDQMKGNTRFDRALTLGAEVGGNYWGRAADAVGIAAGFLRTGAAYRDATADTTLAGYAASGNERIGELYYRYRVNNRFDLTPDFQLIQRAGGDASAPSVKLVGLRARLGF
jgi:hypothetical protein